MSEQTQHPFVRLTNLGSAGLGATVVAVSDDFFAPAERMLADGPAIWIADKYDENGKWMDGWESRRLRGPGNDWAVVKLAAPGLVAGVDVDTSYFTGNYPPACRIEACRVEGNPDERTRWQEIVALSPLGPNASHHLLCNSKEIFTHVRLHIHPDGGVARLRIYGQPHLDREAINGATVDLASALNGAKVVAFSDAHYGSYERMLAPGRGLNMGDGWETRRRREPGNDWVIVSLAARGTLKTAIVDTAHYKGNYPDACSLQVADLGARQGGLESSIVASSMFWETALPPQQLSADSLHEFGSQLFRPVGPVTHIRLNIFPDGGISRLRLFGRLVD